MKEKEKKIILITGNQLDYESSIFENYFSYFENKSEIKIKKKISELFISQYYKFPNINHIKIKEFLEKNQNIQHFDQSIFNFWEIIGHYKYHRLEGNINQIKCFNCNRIFSLKKMQNKINCPKCKSNNIFNNILLKNSSVNEYKKLLETIGFQTMKNLFFQIKDEKIQNTSKDKNPIWNLNLRADTKYIIITIGYNENIIELFQYFKDALILKPDNYEIHSLSIYEEKKESFSSTKQVPFISENVTEFLENIQKII